MTEIRPGRTLDVMIAERIMDRKVIYGIGNQAFYVEMREGIDNNPVPVPNFSTDLTEIWKTWHWLKGRVPADKWDNMRAELASTREFFDSGCYRAAFVVCAVMLYSLGEIEIDTYAAALQYRG